MTTPRVCIFDIETRKWAKDLNPDDEQAGWDDLRAGRGGASAIAVYDTRDNFLYLYDDHTPEAVARHLEQADLVVGFNSEGFDIPCLEGLAGRRLRIQNHLDIYASLAAAIAHRGRTSTRGDLTLERISKQNLGRGKINHGDNARELARRGFWGQLFNYCADDVHLTRDLYYRICRDGGLINLGGQFTTLHLPEHLKLRVGDIP